MFRIVEEYQLVIKLKLVKVSDRGLTEGTIPEIYLDRQMKTRVFIHTIRCSSPDSNCIFPKYRS
jgi:hypothetical protein